MTNSAIEYAANFAAALDQLPPGQADEIERMAVTELLDPDFYLAANPGVAEAEIDPVDHFIELGWRELRKPRRDFDVWWYWAAHLDPARDDINPLLHYAAVGRGEGLSTRPDPSVMGEGLRLATGRPVRRAILFAAFDRDGVVDEATLNYLRELSRHGDVYYLADCYIAPSELAKLDEITAGAWSVRHGAYDFGSYSMLARDLVGWDLLTTYDEVLFVNDSCHLLRPLDEVFEQMASEPCDWWGLQATKGLANTYERDPLSQHVAPVPMTLELLSQFESSPTYDFHIGSYFLAFRTPVIQDPRFRHLIDTVAPQRAKEQTIHKYEIGITHLLIGLGHRFSTFVPTLYPFHPLFSEWAFTLIEGGFPLLKQYLLEHNHYDVPDLKHWHARVHELVPDAPLSIIEDRFRRTGADDRIQRSFAVTRRGDGSIVVPEALHGTEFAERDLVTRRDRNLWAFVVDSKTHRLSESALALADAVARKAGQRITVLTMSSAFDVSTLPARKEISTFPVSSVRGRQALLSAGTVVASGDPWFATGVPVLSVRRSIVVARDGFADLDASDVPERYADDVAFLHASVLLAASDADLLMGLPTMWPVPYAHGSKTGLPAHDLLTADWADLPVPIQTDEERLRVTLDGRPLVLLAPGARRELALSFDDGTALTKAVASAGAVLGIRSADGDLDRPYDRLLGHAGLDLSPLRYSSRVAVLRAAAVVVTDDEGLALDLVALQRPVVLLPAQEPVTALPVPARRLLAALPSFDPETFESMLVSMLHDTLAPSPAVERLRAFLDVTTDGASVERTLQTIHNDRARSLTKRLGEMS